MMGRDLHDGDVVRAVVFFTRAERGDSEEREQLKEKKLIYFIWQSEQCDCWKT